MAANLAAPLLLWVLLWTQLAHEWMVNDQYGYALFVPFLGAYLLFRRWEDRPDAVPPKRGSALIIGVLLVGSIIALYPLKIIFDANADWRMVSWTQGGCAMLVTLAFIFHWGGRPWVFYFLPALAYWLFAIPWPTGIENPVVDNLMSLVAGWVVVSSNLLGIFAERSGNIIVLSNGTVSVQEACSGVRSLQSTLMAAYFLGELLRFSWPLRIGMIIAGCLLAILFNFVRTLTLTIVTAREGGEVMQDRWHDPAGYLVFVMSVVGLLLIVAILQKLRPIEERAVDGMIPASDKSQPRYTRPIPLIIAIVAMILSIPAVGAWYSAREQRSAFHGWNVDWDGANSQVDFFPIEQRVKDILHFEDGQLAKWAGPDQTRWVAYFLRWDDARSAQLGGIHNPEACLPYVGWRLVKKGDDYTWKSPDGLDLIFNTYEFVHGSTKLYVFYCQWDRTAFPYHKKVGREVPDRFRDAWLGERKEGKIKFELFVYNARSREQALVELERLLNDSIQPEIHEAG
ncbi:MAG: exosortase/archaeosortase family protein [Verrucomicrobiota bacterium]